MHINAKILYFDSEQIMGKSFIIRVLHLLNILPCTLLILRIFTNLKICNKFHRPSVVRFKEEKGGGHYHTSDFFYSRMKLMRFIERSVCELWYSMTGDC